MKPVAFAYERPESVEQVLTLLAEHGDAARILAGGQSLVARLNQRLERPTVVIDINRLVGLDTIEVGADTVRIGALVRQADLLADPEAMRALPLVRAALPRVGNVATRNRGTVCGSIANADPMAQLPLVGAVGGASVELRGPAGTRTVGLATARRHDELIVSVTFERAGDRHGYAELTHAVTLGAAAVQRTGSGVRIGVATGLGPPHLGEVTDDVAFLDDVHADADYRRGLARTLVARALEAAA